MRRSTPKPIRNKLDLTDRAQMRLARKRLGLSDAELAAIVGRIGNSISAISKEAAKQRASAPPKPADVPPAAVIASAAATEPIPTELAAAVPPS
jgi:DNA-binding XRE family transcriptional regulator